MNTNKEILFCDMDGVVANFNKYILDKAPHLNLGSDMSDEEYEVNSTLLDEFCMSMPRFFEDLEPIDGAIDAVTELNDKYDIYFLSTPMWAIPESYTGKRIWLENHFGDIAKKKLILSHRKDLLSGSFLIDDRLKHGVDKFVGEHLHYGTDRFPTWESINKYLM